MRSETPACDACTGTSRVACPSSSPASTSHLMSTVRLHAVRTACARCRIDAISKHAPACAGAASKLLTLQTMSECECSECGVSASRHVWGFALLARGGWTVARSERQSGARSWLCAECAQRDESEWHVAWFDSRLASARAGRTRSGTAIILRRLRLVRVRAAREDPSWPTTSTCRRSPSSICRSRSVPTLRATSAHRKRFP